MHWIRGRWTVVSLLLTTPVMLLSLAIFAVAQVVTTTVTDTIYQANGTPAQGTVVVTWPAFTTAAGQTVAAGTSSATIGANGVLTLTLTPNAGATPMGTYYTAVYHLSDGSVNREYWVVPVSSAAVHLSAIRSSVLPTSVAMQTVSKSYVDTAIAAAVAGTPLDESNPYVLKAGDTMTGALVLAADPTSASQAATKSYVDTNVAGVAAGMTQKVTTLPYATQTVTQPAGTQLEANRENGVLYASQFQEGRGDNGIANALADPDCATGCEIKVEPTYNAVESYKPAQWNSGTHVEDARLGGRRDSYTNPENAVQPGFEAGQTISVTATRDTSAIAQVTETPASVGLRIEHTGLAGGSNQFVQGIGTVPYFKMGYSALAVAGVYNTQGQHVLAPNEIHCYGVGDCLIGSQFIYSSGGQRDNADEGAHPFDLQVREDPQVFTGVCASGCTTGSTVVMVSPTAAGGTQGDGRFLIDTAPAKTLSDGVLTGVGQSGPHPSAAFSGTSFATSTLFRVAAAIPSQAKNVAPGTVTVTLATTGLPTGYASNTAAAPAASGVACVADPSVPNNGIEDFETANYSVVDGTHLQLTLNKAHFANATVAIGGLCGYGIEQTVDTSAGIRQVFPVIGSYSGTGLYYAGVNTAVLGSIGHTSGYANVSLNVTSAVRSGNTVTVTTAGSMPRDLNGLTLTMAGMADASFNGSYVVTTTSSNTLTYAQTGANSSTTGGTVSIVTGGYKLYPMVEVLSVMNPSTRQVDGYMALAPNTVAWSASDPVEQPHYHQQKIGPDLEYIGQTMPRPTVYQEAGLQYEGNNGAGLHGWSVKNMTPASNYFGNGGTHAVPDVAYVASGAWQTVLDAQAGEQAVFNVSCNSHGCGRWNSAYNLFQLQSNAGTDVIGFNPLTSALTFNLRGASYSVTPQALNAGTINATTVNATTLNGAVSAAQLPVFQGSGASHAAGAVPDPGATAGTSRYLREDGTWATPSGLGTTSSSVGSVPGAATADYNFLEGSGTVLTDHTGNGNNGTLGTGSAAPTWTATGLYFPGGSRVSLPTALNGSRTVLAAVYINPLGTSYQSTSISYPAIVTSSAGASGLNLMLLFKRDANSSAFAPSIYYASGGVVTGTSIRLAGFHVLAYVLGSSTDSTVDHLYIDGVEVGDYAAQSASAGRQTSGNLFLGASGAGAWTGNVNQTMYRVVTYDGVLSSSDVQRTSELMRSEVASRGVPVAPQGSLLASPMLHAIGDSITYGQGVTTPWPSLLSLTGQSYTVKNWGIPGFKAAEAVGTESNRAALSCKTMIGVPSVAMVFLGTNDLAFGIGTPEQVFADLAGEIQTLKRAGCTVFAATMLSRSGTSSDGSGTTMDAYKDAYDATILNRARAAGADGIVDFAANPLLGADGASANTTYFQDGTHPTQAGAQLLANAASNTLNYYFGYNLSNANVVSSSSYTMASGDGAVTASVTANAAWTLPDCTGPSGATYTITNPQSAYTLTIQGQANQPINGLTTAVTVPSNATVTLHDVPNPKSASGCHWTM